MKPLRAIENETLPYFVFNNLLYLKFDCRQNIIRIVIGGILMSLQLWWFMYKYLSGKMIKFIVVLKSFKFISFPFQKYPTHIPHRLALSLFLSLPPSPSLSLKSTPLNVVNVKKSILSREIYYGHIKCVVCLPTFVLPSKIR